MAILRCAVSGDEGNQETDVLDVKFKPYSYKRLLQKWNLSNKDSIGSADDALNWSLHGLMVLGL